MSGDGSSKRGPVVIEEMPGTSFSCSFCGRGAWAGFIEGEPAVVHELPTCQTYDTLEPDAFVSAIVKAALAQGEPVAPSKAPN